MRLPENKKYHNKSIEVREFSFEKNYKLVYLTVISFFLGFFICVSLGFRTIIPLLTFIKILVFVVFSSWAIQYYFFRSIFLMKSMEYLMVAFFGLAPMIMAIFLSLNYFIHLKESTNTYKLKKTYEDANYQYFNVDGLPCEQYPELCVEHKENMKMKVGGYVEITLAKGLFGFETISEIKEVPK